MSEVKKETKAEETTEQKIAKIKTKISDAEQALIHRAMAVESASGSLKAARQLYKLAIEKLQGLRVELAMAENPSPPVSEQVDEDGDPIEAEFEVVDDTQSVISEPATTAASPTAWGEASIAVLGLKESLVNRLNEHDVWTIGQLEELRGKISMGRAEWPKGIGKAKVTEIEDAITDYLRKTRDREVFDALKNPTEVVVVVSENDGVIEALLENSIPVKAELPNDPMPASESDNNRTESDHSEDPLYFLPDRPTTAQWQAMNEGEQAQYLEARAADFHRIAVEHPSVLNPVLPSGGYFHRGQESHSDGEPVLACELPSSPAQDDFIRGWVQAEIDSPSFFPAANDGDLTTGVLSEEESEALTSNPEPSPVVSRHAKAGVVPLPHAGASLFSSDDASDALDDL